MVRLERSSPRWNAFSRHQGRGLDVLSAALEVCSLASAPDIHLHVARLAFLGRIGCAKRPIAINGAAAGSVAAQARRHE